MLVEIGDKPKSFIGTKDWIGALEVSYVLNKKLGVESKILFIQDGSQIRQHLE